MKTSKYFLIASTLLIILLGAIGYYISQKNVETPGNVPSISSIKSYPKPFPLHHAEFSTFLNAMQTAGLEHLFQDTGPFTGFIPTNEAFEKLDKNTWVDLLKPENQDRLTAILTYHMISGKYNINHLNRIAPTSFKTINGNYIDVVVENKETRVNNAKIIQANLEGPNWMVHKIDTVLIPGQL